MLLPGKAVTNVDGRILMARARCIIKRCPECGEPGLQQRKALLNHNTYKPLVPNVTTLPMGRAEVITSTGRMYCPRCEEWVVAINDRKGEED